MSSVEDLLGEDPIAGESGPERRLPASKKGKGAERVKPLVPPKSLSMASILAGHVDPASPGGPERDMHLHSEDEQELPAIYPSGGEHSPVGEIASPRVKAPVPISPGPSPQENMAREDVMTSIAAVEDLLSNYIEKDIDMSRDLYDRMGEFIDAVRLLRVIKDQNDKIINMLTAMSERPVESQGPSKAPQELKRRGGGAAASGSKPVPKAAVDEGLAKKNLERRAALLAKLHPQSRGEQS